MTMKSSEDPFHFRAEETRGSDSLKHQAGLTQVLTGKWAGGLNPNLVVPKSVSFIKDCDPQRTVIAIVWCLVYLAEGK